MNEDELKAIVTKYSPKVRLWCDEAHAHSIMDPRCYEGDEDAIMVLRLVHTIRRDRSLITSAMHQMKQRY